MKKKIVITSIIFLLSIIFVFAQNFDVSVQVNAIGPGPILILVSPESISYNTNQNLLLNFSVSNQDYLWYNIDNGNNITINSSTLFNTTFGSHILYLFATNFEGNTSRNVNFNVVQPSSGGGGSTNGGGGSGGGGVACQVTWDCTEWSNPAQECGTRTCTDVNKCNTNVGKPSEIVTCPAQGIAPPEPYCGDKICNGDERTNTCEADCSVLDDARLNLGIVFWTVVSILIIGTIVIGFLIVKRIIYVQSLKTLANS